jgi:hypothetical protein
MMAKCGYFFADFLALRVVLPPPRPPAGLGLDWPEHGGILDRIGAGGACHIIAKLRRGARNKKILGLPAGLDRRG